MYKYRYKNPMTKQYQAEYVLYEAIAKLFAEVSCRSLTIDRLKLYHAELSDHAKKDLEKEIRYLIGKYVTGQVCFPAMDICKAEVKIRNNPDGTHLFIFTDEVYSFRVCLKHPGKGGRRQLEVKDRNLKNL